MNNTDSTPPGGGLAGSLKIIAGLAVLVLAVMAALLVLDVIPQELFKAVLTKILLLAVVAASAVAALWGLMRAGR